MYRAGIEGVFFMAFLAADRVMKLKHQRKPGFLGLFSGRHNTPPKPTVLAPLIDKGEWSVEPKRAHSDVIGTQSHTHHNVPESSHGHTHTAQTRPRHTHTMMHSRTSHCTCGYASATHVRQMTNVLHRCTPLADVQPQGGYLL